MAGSDVVIVGAGSAGIAAARALHDAGQDVVLVEAASRVGGRAHSATLCDFTVDLGCGWLHSAMRNPWTALAGEYGLTVERHGGKWRSQWRNLGYLQAEQAAFAAAWERWSAAAHAALDGPHGSPDQPLSAFIADDDPWRARIDAISGYANGAPLTQVSLHDWAAYEDAATDDNWVVKEGYGTLVARHAAGVPVRLATRVTRIDHRARVLRVETDRGVLETRAVIVAVPTTVLAKEAIRFDPPLPDKHAAATDLPLGLADKIFLHVEHHGDLAPDSHLTGNPHSACTGSYRLAPFGWPVIESFIGGECAALLADKDDRAAADFAIGELVALLGSDWRDRLTLLARTNWRHEPHIESSYSHARIGAAGQRAVLAAPVDSRLFFAGEACSAHDFSTAHGAYETGVAAASAVLAANGGQARPAPLKTRQ